MVPCVSTGGVLLKDATTTAVSVLVTGEPAETDSNVGFWHDNVWLWEAMRWVMHAS